MQISGVFAKLSITVDLITSSLPSVLFQFARQSELLCCFAHTYSHIHTQTDTHKHTKHMLAQDHIYTHTHTHLIANPVGKSGK